MATLGERQKREADLPQEETEAIEPPPGVAPQPRENATKMLPNQAILWQRLKLGDGWKQLWPCELGVISGG